MIEMSECEQIRDKLYAMAAGGCDSESAGAIQAHMDKCRECAAEFDRMRELVRLTGMLEDVKSSCDLYPEIASRMRVRFYWLKVGAAAAAAAVFVILILYSVMGPVKPAETNNAPVQANKQVKSEQEQLVEKAPGNLPRAPRPVQSSPRMTDRQSPTDDLSRNPQQFQ